MARIHRITLALAAAVALSGFAVATQQESPRERWNAMSPAERAKLVERFRAFQQMDENERRALHERFQRLKGVEERLRERLPEDARRDLAGLDPGARRDAWRETLERELAERGKDLREILPDAWRQRLESAPPHLRGRVLEELRQHLRGDLADRALHSLARDLALPPQEVERLRNLEPEERASEIAELRRRDLVGRVEQHGLPPTVTPEEWARWKELSATEFFERWHERVKGAPPPRGAPPAEGQPAPGRPPPVAPGGAPQPRDGTRPKIPPDRLAKLGEAMRPDPRWFAELSRLEPSARREAVDGRIRERVLEHLAELPELFGPDDLAKLREMRFPELIDAVKSRVRQVAPPPPRGERPPPGAPPPGTPHGPPPQRPQRSL